MVTKKCNVQGCNNKSWSKGVCKMHTPRSPIKSCPLPQKKTPIEVVVDDAFKQAMYKHDRNVFFNSIWAQRPHICQHCGKYLGNEPRTYMFDHLLEKQKYKKLEFEEENIWLVCLECHDEKSRGIITDKYREKINFVITKFNVS